VTGALPRPVNFHHLWVGDGRRGASWLTPAREHFDALRESRFDGIVRVGIVGGRPQREEAEHWLDGRWPTWGSAAVADEGFEMVTLDALHRFAKAADPATPVLYTHGKGSFQPSPHSDAWRRNMTGHLVAGWRHCVNSLHEADAVGCHWLTAAEYPGKILQPGIFGGNFWWANAGYLAKLAPVEWASRWCAEGWVGLGDPKVECLADGWPSY
jgi:hypothetical protein